MKKERSERMPGKYKEVYLKYKRMKHATSYRLLETIILETYLIPQVRGYSKIFGVDIHNNIIYEIHL